ncbi:PqqD family peptide modification chaperone [Agromyces sp. GXQ0307]|uniref:PqqD family peptide modification chaperone n=1 Tax=Agromyces sp. GXQ0307 TaxID=3377835 RepID=UPI00383B7A96
MVRLRVADAVGVVEQDDVLYLAHLPGGPILVLDGPGALIWTEACAGPRETVVERVAEAAGAPTDLVRDDVERLVADLVARGVLAVEA